MNILRTLPKDVTVALSGGIDSVVLLHFLSKKHNVTAAHYVHNNKYAEKEYVFVQQLCNNYKIDLIVEAQVDPMPANCGKEKYWRDGRYKFFKSLDAPVCTGHTLDDMVAWYLMTCMRGEGHLMTYDNGNVVRPFICTKKEELIDYAKKHNLEWLEDPSNADVEFTQRNRVVNKILPEALKVNPGLYSTIKNKFLKKFAI